MGEGDLAGLEALLAEDVELHGDGGGKAPALARPISGRVRAARTLRAWARAGRRWARCESTACWSMVSPARSCAIEGFVTAVMSLEIAEGQIQAIRSIVNPEKLIHLT